MKLSAYWEVEDTFFGAILGAILGVFVDKLPIQYTTLMVFFFILFPMLLRKAEALSRYSLVTAITISTIWMLLLVYDLNSQSIIPFEKSSVFLVIFFGWLMSLSIRIVSR